MEERFIHNRAILAEKQQEAISGASVAVVGLGGLGGYVLEMLLRVGVGSIRCFDPDSFEGSNLNRQLLCTEADLGVAKVSAAVERGLLVHSHAHVTGVQELLTDANAVELLTGVDIVVDCVDSVASRFVLQEACACLELPLVHGAVAGWMGQVAVIMPGAPGFEIIYGPKDTVLPGNQGNGAFLPAIIASYQVSEVVKLITKQGSSLAGKLYQLDAFRVTDTTIILQSK